ncbi:MAG: zinc finger domain-containing protein, partial [Candidatus Paceibacterota bacterium]
FASRARFGPEPHADDFDFQYFWRGLQRSKQNIKARLLDQTFIAGLGNIYVDESLFRAGIAPTRPAQSLTPTEAKKLAREAGKVLKEAIAAGGTTFQSFKDSTGRKGNYTKKLKVFGRHGQPCPKCGYSILKIRVAGRGTHYCEQCQK